MMTGSTRLPRLVGLAIGVAVAVAACSPAAESTPIPTDIPDDLDWRDIPLTDVRSGESFALADFGDQVVIVDLMAVWCPNCLLQQQQLQIASSEWSDDEVVIVSLDVDPNESVPILLKHAEDYHIGWRSAMSPQGMTNKLVAEFGPIVTSVSATPLILIGPGGEAELIGRGLKPKKVLLELVEERQ
jgi:thiol-disulfide isomerase/thioredoxin